jgi:hypothetical protein
MYHQLEQRIALGKIFFYLVATDWGHALGETRAKPQRGDILVAPSASCRTARKCGARPRHRKYK